MKKEMKYGGCFFPVFFGFLIAVGVLFFLGCHIQKRVDPEILEAERALKNEEFVVYFQPKFCLSSSTVGGAEALVRWKQPRRGLIPPDDFIPRFEKNGFIVSLDLYVFEQVCKKLREWLDDGIEAIPISVNVSKLHFYTPDDTEKYISLVRGYNIPSRLLVLEITESVAVENVEYLKNVLEGWKEEGMRIALDDFGTGYSSLNLLSKLPFDELKLDKEFMLEISRSEKSRILVSSLIKMAHQLKMDLVAEGVETEEQYAFLKAQGCDTVQGYFYSPPLPIEEFERQFLRGR